MKEEEIEEATQVLTLIPLATPLMENSRFCYWGSRVELDANRRPIDFIGPLEHDFLPDSPVRRFMWIASLTFEILGLDFLQFIKRLPRVNLIRKIEAREPFVSSSTQATVVEDCFDEAFRQDSWYKAVAQDIPSYKRFRSLAFERSSPIPLMKKIGYRQVGASNLKMGDLIVYFSHVNRNRETSFRTKRMMSHYGRVSQVTPNGEIRIVSKILPSYIYEHPIDCLPYFLGSGYLFFTPQSPSSHPTLPETDEKEES